ncbi:MAG: hypothetical protein Q7R90_00965 [bacterium]|nr:hypothetical protein [bacterium]
MEIDIKGIFAIVAAVITVGAFFPYIRDLLQGRTQPHIYTWLIWAITQSTAVAGIWYGGGGWGAVNLTAGTSFVFVVFLLSFKYGTRNITTFDTVMFIAALGAIFVWWGLNNPVLAVLLATAIDIVGYSMTFRKSFEEPWSETVGTWAAFVVGNILSIFALNAFNILTLAYIVTIIVANAIVVGICLIRRRVIPKP